MSAERVLHLLTSICTTLTNIQYIFKVDHGKLSLFSIFGQGRTIQDTESVLCPDTKTASDNNHFVERVIFPRDVVGPSFAVIFH